jgi:hypothetical protein
MIIIIIIIIIIISILAQHSYTEHHAGHPIQS